RSPRKTRKSSRVSHGISVTATSTCKCWATDCASGAITCWRTCFAASARGLFASRRHSTRSLGHIYTDITRTMGIKQQRRRPKRGRRMVRDVTPPPFVPAKAGTQIRNRAQAALGPGSRFARPGHENVDSRLRGNERSKSKAPIDQALTADKLDAADL